MSDTSSKNPLDLAEAPNAAMALHAPTHVAPLVWPPRPKRPADAGQSSWGVFSAAFLGTALAGGLFPIAVAAIGTAYSVLLGRGPSLQDLASIPLVLVAVFLLGVLLAGAVALLILPFLGIVLWMAGLSRWRRAVASYAGGWCGFAAVLLLAHGEPSVEPLVFAFGAMIMGHLGAAWCVRRLAPPDSEDSSARGGQVPLRQLFGVTTGLAAILAVLSLLPIPERTLVVIAVFVGVQVAMVGGLTMARRLVGRDRSRIEGRMAAENVPRETTDADCPS